MQVVVHNLPIVIAHSDASIAQYIYIYISYDDVHKYYMYIYFFPPVGYVLFDKLDTLYLIWYFAVDFVWQWKNVVLLLIYIYFLVLYRSLVTCCLAWFGNVFGTTDLPTLIGVSFLTVFGRQVTNTTCSRNLQDIQHLILNNTQGIVMTEMYDTITNTIQAAGLTPVMDRYIYIYIYNRVK